MLGKTKFIAIPNIQETENENDSSRREPQRWEDDGL